MLLVVVVVVGGGGAVKFAQILAWVLDIDFDVWTPSKYPTLDGASGEFKICSNIEKAYSILLKLRHEVVQCETHIPMHSDIEK